MASHRLYTDAENATIVRMRADGVTWKDIAFALKTSNDKLIIHARLVLKIRTGKEEDARPLVHHLGLMEVLCRRGYGPADIADEINDRDRTANATDETVLQAIEFWSLERPALPAGHSVTWGAIVAGTATEGHAYAR